MKCICNKYYPIKVGLSVIVSLMLFMIGCATVSEEERNKSLEPARSAYEQAKNNPEIPENAPVALHEAAQALQKAEQAKDIEEIKHLAYLSERKTQIATALAEQKKAEKERERLINEKDKILLKAREYEIEQAKKEAEMRTLEAEKARKEAAARALELERARGEADALARQAEKVRKEAEAKALEIEKAKSEAEAKALQVEQAQKEAEARALELEKAKKETEAKALEIEKAKSEAEAKALEAEKARLEAEEAMAQRKQLESELEELKAKKTDRGIILTLGDILFEVGKDILMPGATLTIDKLAEFLKKYPNRDVLIEGYTDSTGSETYNLGLSLRRADSVGAQLIEKGIEPQRITTKGYGERFPIASNANSAGRQQNRRVEIIILDEGVSAEKMLR